jgi:uncharacterized DUF497 family protein
MKGLRFEWDEAKSRSNLRKHGLSFEEAVSVFADDFAQLIADPDHSEAEERFILLGMSGKLRILVVCHSFDPGARLVRVISCRKANRREMINYRR